MNTREIPRPEWRSFLDGLSRVHMEDPVTIEVLSLEIGAQLQVIGRPFEGITAETHGHASAITISAGSRPDDHICHTITDPLRLRVLCDPYGQESVIEIESADASTTLVHFDTWR